jgi:large subunit ribosomal protein L31
MQRCYTPTAASGLLERNQFQSSKLRFLEIPNGRQSLESGAHMKKDIHPKMVPCKIIYSGEVVMETYSTKPEITVDVWSGVHPFWTGQQRFLDTEGRVEKFQKRFQGSYRKK